MHATKRSILQMKEMGNIDIYINLIYIKIVIKSLTLPSQVILKLFCKNLQKLTTKYFESVYLLQEKINRNCSH